MMELQITWFVLIVVLLTVYAVLDGFDFGVGFWHLFSKDSDERQTGINSIAPVWDGNEVWLLTGGGALFAAFPPAYATIFSSFYMAVILLMVALVFRAVSIEFRGLVDSEAWKKRWDFAFGLGSTLPPVLLGVVAGNLVVGLNIDHNGNYTGTFFELLNPFSLLVGVMTLLLFAGHGALYLALKTEGDFSKVNVSRAKKSWPLAVISILGVVLWAVFGYSRVTGNFIENPLLIGLPLFAVTAAISVWYFVLKEKILMAFSATSATIAALGVTIATALFPYLVFSKVNSDQSLTLYNSSSSELTHSIMLVIALIGVPIVIGYTIFVYKLFSGKATSEVHY